MQKKDREDNAFPFFMLLVILLGLDSLELDEVVTSSSPTITMAAAGHHSRTSPSTAPPPQFHHLPTLGHHGSLFRAPPSPFSISATNQRHHHANARKTSKNHNHEPAPVRVNHCRRKTASSSLQQSQIHVPPSSNHSCNLRTPVWPSQTSNKNVQPAGSRTSRFSWTWAIPRNREPTMHHHRSTIAAADASPSPENTTAPPRRSNHHVGAAAPSHTAKGGRRVWEWNPNSGEILSAPRVMFLLDSQTGQLVKASSQLWSKLQKWLNKRGRIGNWTGIKLLIN